MLAKRIALYAMGPVGVAALSFIILPLLTWIATPETVAIYSLFTVVLNLTVMASSFGLDQALVRFYYTVPNKLQLLFTTMLPGLLLLAVVTFIIYLFKYDVSANTIGLASANVALFTAIFLSYHSRFLSLVLRMEDKAFQYSFSQLLPKLWLLAALFYLYFAQQQVSGINIVYLLLVGWMLVVIYQAYYVNNAKLTVAENETEKASSKTLWYYGLPLLISSCSYYLLTVSDKFFIKQMIDLSAVAQYATSAHFANAIFIVQSVFIAIWPPFVYKMFETSSQRENVQHIIKLTGIMMSVTVVILWSLTGLASTFVEFLLPAEYSDIRQLMPILVAVPLLCLLAEVSGIGINLEKRTVYHSIATMTALVANLSLNYLLIPLYGVSGAGIATVLSFSAYFVIKTESAARLGYPIQRAILYCALMVLLSVSIYFALFEVERMANAIIWLLLLSAVVVPALLQKNKIIKDLVWLKNEVENV